MKKILVTICFIVCCILAGAQNISVASFQHDESDLTANLQGTTVFDQNGGKCALIRIQTTQKGFTFDVGVLGIQKVDDNKPGEIWVYVPAGVKRMDIRHQQLGSLIGYVFPVSIQAAKTYVMELTSSKVHTIVEHDDGMSYFALVVKPANAMVLIDGHPQELDAEGSLMTRMSRGEHTYQIQSAGYASVSDKFILGATTMTKEIALQSVKAKLSLSCETSGASLYVNDAMKAVGSWSGELLAGTYLLEARKDGHYSQKQTVTLAERDNQSIKLSALTAKLGKLDVSYKPIGCEVFVDGAKVGTSPNIFSSILVGSHKVEIRKDGYVSKEHYVTIDEGQTASLTGSLEKNAVLTSSVPSASQASANGASLVPITVNGVTFNMVHVKGGTFTMGATSEQGSDAYNSEKPTHRVTLSSYYIGETEVTQALWQAVMGNNPSSFKGDNLPVETVSWNDCQEFIRKLNALAGKKFRLPTEAEWEFAARGGTKSCGYKYSGSNTIGDVAWYNGNSEMKTHSVKTKSPNELGLYDMSGNVWEWCSDWYDSYKIGLWTNPTGPLGGSARVYRGGGWGCNPWLCRVSSRGNGGPAYRRSDLGLRLVLDDVHENKISNESKADVDAALFDYLNKAGELRIVGSGTGISKDGKTSIVIQAAGKGKIKATVYGKTGNGVTFSNTPLIMTLKNGHTSAAYADLRRSRYINFNVSVDLSGNALSVRVSYQTASYSRYSVSSVVPLK